MNFTIEIQWIRLLEKARLHERMVKRHMVVAKRMLERWLRLRQAMLLLSRSFKAIVLRV